MSILVLMNLETIMNLQKYGRYVYTDRMMFLCFYLCNTHFNPSIQNLSHVKKAGKIRHQNQSGLKIEYSQLLLQLKKYR